ncbi:unnamed protein product, partial [Echinostoma caproni]|uniref:MI domain-containing protein n=1 Tax=Echinostoma caproni TaxID=27848 RepID=A0A183B0Q5_9TREM
KIESSATPTIGSKRSPDANNGVGSDDGGASDVKKSRTEKSDASDSPKVSSAAPASSAPITTNSGASRGYFPAQMHVTTDEVRLKAREMIQSALEVGKDSLVSVLSFAPKRPAQQHFYTLMHELQS